MQWYNRTKKGFENLKNKTEIRIRLILKFFFHNYEKNLPSISKKKTPTKITKTCIENDN